MSGSSTTTTKSSRTVSISLEPRTVALRPFVPGTSRSDGDKSIKQSTKARRNQAEDFHSWYVQVLLDGDLVDRQDSTGCLVIKPSGWFIWEEAQRYLDEKLKALGVQNYALPNFVVDPEPGTSEGWRVQYTPKDECTIRPSSEADLYPLVARWIKSDRDLPLRLNQWSSVLRLDTRHVEPLLHSQEFHWQQAHTAHATHDSATKEVRDVVKLYTDLFEDVLAIPVLVGTKPMSSTLPGATTTITIEAIIPKLRRSIQAAAINELSQNFSKAFDIRTHPAPNNGDVQNSSKFVWQNSWALTSRLIGIVAMIHGDDRGIVLPPKLAPNQVAIMSIWSDATATEQDKAKVHALAHRVEEVLGNRQVRITVDDVSDQPVGRMYQHWETRGTPLRIEIGPREADGDFVTAVRRDTGDRQQVRLATLESEIQELLDTVQHDLFERASAGRTDSIQSCMAWESFMGAMKNNHLCTVPHCGETHCEEKVFRSMTKLERMPYQGNQSLPWENVIRNICVPYNQNSDLSKMEEACFRPGCTNRAKAWCLFG